MLRSLAARRGAEKGAGRRLGGGGSREPAPDKASAAGSQRRQRGQGETLSRLPATAPQCPAERAAPAPSLQGGPEGKAGEGRPERGGIGRPAGGACPSPADLGLPGIPLPVQVSPRRLYRPPALGGGGQNWRPYGVSLIAKGLEGLPRAGLKGADIWYPDGISLPGTPARPH